MNSSSMSLFPQASKATTPSFKEGYFGTPDPMFFGKSSVASDAAAKHPLEFSERQYAGNQDNLNYTMLKRIQGIHAPQRLLMERQAASRIQRLPFLPSSNLMLDTLTGKDDTITFEDIYNDPNNCESMMNPHLVMEKTLNHI